MGAISTMRKLAGIGDDAAALAAELRAARTEGARALDEAERLEAARLTAATFAAAEDLERQAAAARWRADKAAAGLPDLEARLATVQAKERAEALERHRQRQRTVYGKLRVALLAAADAQMEAISADKDACRELGEHVARSHLPPVAFRGFLFPDLVGIWIVENDRQFAAQKPAQARKAAAPSAPKPRQYLPHEKRPHTDASRAVSLALSDQAHPKKPRTPDDLSPLENEQVRVRVSRSGYSPADDLPQCQYGQIIKMPRGAAQRAADAGAVEIIEEAALSTEKPE
jgi:hypothetical protein